MRRDLRLTDSDVDNLTIGDAVHIRQDGQHWKGIIAKVILPQESNFAQYEYEIQWVLQNPGDARHTHTTTTPTRSNIKQWLKTGILDIEGVKREHFEEELFQI